MTLGSDDGGRWDPELERAETERLMLDAVAAAIEGRSDLLGACFGAANHDDALSLIALNDEARRRIDMEREDSRSRLAG